MIIVIIDAAAGYGVRRSVLQFNELENGDLHRLNECHRLLPATTAMQFPAWHLYLSFLTHLTRAKGKQEHRSTEL